MGALSIRSAIFGGLMSLVAAGLAQAQTSQRPPLLEPPAPPAPAAPARTRRAEISAQAASWPPPAQALWTKPGAVTAMARSLPVLMRLADATQMARAPPSPAPAS